MTKAMKGWEDIKTCVRLYLNKQQCPSLLHPTCSHGSQPSTTCEPKKAAGNRSESENCAAEHRAAEHLAMGGMQL